jgi:hypothetical protein
VIASLLQCCISDEPQLRFSRCEFHHSCRICPFPSQELTLIHIIKLCDAPLFPPPPSCRRAVSRRLNSCNAKWHAGRQSNLKAKLLFVVANLSKRHSDATFRLLSSAPFGGRARASPTTYNIMGTETFVLCFKVQSDIPTDLILTFIYELPIVNFLFPFVIARKRVVGW